MDALGRDISSIVENVKVGSLVVYEDGEAYGLVVDASDRAFLDVFVLIDNVTPYDVGKKEDWSVTKTNIVSE